MASFSWDQRIQRVETLLHQYAFVQDVLKFTREVLRFQQEVYRWVEQKLGLEVFAFQTSVRRLLSERWGVFGGEESERPLRSDFLDVHLPVFFPLFAEYLDLIRRVGPPTLAAVAYQLQVELTAEEARQVLQAYWRHETLSTGRGETEEEQRVLAFLAKLFLQPYAEFL
ncbi:MAG: hypothetical protein NZ742_10855, partial [Acidobacteria bacterium]|nr:hypothetical protein [Acidobacteriota bacterium]MDW7985202.1 hypothetical protein [Acidobacteriota bacterium]